MRKKEANEKEIKNSSQQQMEKLLKKYNYFSNHKQKKTMRYIQIYGFTILMSIAGLFLQYYLNQFLSKSNHIFLLFISIALSAWYGSFFAGLLAVFIAAIGADYFFIYPHHFFIHNIADFILIFIFICEGILISLLIAKSQQNKEIEALRKREKDYTELIIYQKEAIEKAKAEIKSRDEFLSIASHELKTPLTSMLIKLQSALRNIRTVSLANFSVENLMKMLESTEQQTMRLSKMINDLLNVSLTTSGRIDLELEKVDLKNVVESIIERFSEKAKVDGYTIKFDGKEKVIGLWDKVRLEQVISNLLSNAIKYGNGKPIHISLQKHHDVARLTITDQGIGISHEDQKRIFALFERGVSAKDYKGLGVGLYITNQIVHAHKGTITVDSTVGEGSKFIVELPIKSNE